MDFEGRLIDGLVASDLSVVNPQIDTCLAQLLEGISDRLFQTRISTEANGIEERKVLIRLKCFVGLAQTK